MVTLLTFEVADRRFAVPTPLVREVIRAVAISPLPKSPSIVEGVVNCRGTLVPVLDIRQRFGLPAAPLSPTQHFLIAQAGPHLVALRVDAARALVTVAEDDIEPVSGIAPGAEYVAGLARLPDGLLVIHDLERFLSLHETGQVSAALAEVRT